MDAEHGRLEETRTKGVLWRKWGSQIPVDTSTRHLGFRCIIRLSVRA